MDDSEQDKIEDVDGIRSGLLNWFAENSRVLPWRGIEDPYAVWISEIMLQQTQVATVIGYYNRWMERFPTVEALADAELDDVLALWAGLGYYRRARMLHEAAQTLRESGLPKTHSGLKDVKGVGAYTAGAIASIAYGVAVPAVDGNVKRVFARLFTLEDVWSTKGENVVWELAEELVDPESPGDFNESLMELGATICRPKNPTCMLCPIREHCQAFAMGAALDYPHPKPRKKPRKETTHVVACVDDRRVLLTRAEEGGLLGGLWGFPSVELVPEEAEHVGEVEHVFSHIRMTYQVYRFAQAPEVGGETKWVSVDSVTELPMSVAMKKVAGLLSMG